MMILVTNFSLALSDIYVTDFPLFDQKYFFKKVNKIGNSIQLRIIAVINTLLIFRALKSRQVKIFS